VWGGPAFHEGPRHCRHNGIYVPTKGWMEELLMDKMLAYLDDYRKDPSKPFFMYYAPHLMHA